MRVPIQYALTYPERMRLSPRRLDLADIGVLDFERPDTERFPALRLAREAGIAGRTYPTVLSAADDEAVKAFLAGALRFIDIPAVVEARAREASAGGRKCSRLSGKRIAGRVPWPVKRSQRCAHGDDGDLHLTGKARSLDGRYPGVDQCFGASGERRPSGDDIINQYDGEIGEPNMRLHGERSSDIGYSLFRPQIDLGVSLTRTDQRFFDLDSEQASCLLSEK